MIENKKNLNVEALDDDAENLLDLTKLVCRSLKNGHIDWAFTEKQKEAILKYCKQEEVALVYRDSLDKNGKLDYIEFIPVVFHKTPFKEKILQVNIKEILNNEDAWSYKKARAIRY